MQLGCSALLKRLGIFDHGGARLADVKVLQGTASMIPRIRLLRIKNTMSLTAFAAKIS